MPRKYTPEERITRFWNNIDQPAEGCWEWQRGTNGHGYGRLVAENNRFVLAHRFAWELTYGAIPEGMCVLHKCDNPSCCRPEHLFIGTKADNNWDMVSKGRWGPRPNLPRGEQCGHAILTSDQVRLIRSTTLTAAALARMMGVSGTTVRYARRGKTWKHIS